MSETPIPKSLRRLVEQRAEHRCEYCRIPAGVGFFPHEIDHIIAEKHGGKTSEENLAYTCWRCNRYKGTDLGSFDPNTGEFSFLYHPRLQNWVEHFTFEGIRLEGKTPEGRVTVTLLRLNNDDRLRERARLLPESGDGE